MVGLDVTNVIGFNFCLLRSLCRAIEVRLVSLFYWAALFGIKQYIDFSFSCVDFDTSDSLKNVILGSKAINAHKNSALGTVPSCLAQFSKGLHFQLFLWSNLAQTTRFRHNWADFELLVMFIELFVKFSFLNSSVSDFADLLTVFSRCLNLIGDLTNLF